jgi:hypothetical protein
MDKTFTGGSQIAKFVKVFFRKKKFPTVRHIAYAWLMHAKTHTQTDRHAKTATKPVSLPWLARMDRKSKPQCTFEHHNT